MFKLRFDWYIISQQNISSPRKELNKNSKGFDFLERVWLAGDNDVCFNLP